MTNTALGFGWIIAADTGRTRYVEIGDDGEWEWTHDAREAELFTTKESAERFIFRNIVGSARAVEHNW